MLQRLSISALIIAGAFTLARADVYRWVDDKGQPHYSDQWMPGTEVIKTSKAHPPGTEGAMRAADQKNLTASNTGSPSRPVTRTTPTPCSRTSPAAMRCCASNPRTTT